MPKDKYYVVWQGKMPGVYLTWKECEAQIKGQKGAKFMSFGNRQAAEKAYQEGPQKYLQASGRSKGPKKRKGEPIDFSQFTEIEPISWCVDAACSGNPGVMEYRGVDTVTEQQLFIEKFEEGTNNIGEFLAIVHALAILTQKGDSRPVYSDSRIAMNWVKRDKRCKTKLVPNPKNARLFKVIARAERWLAQNSFSNRILKWETKLWGEIPADFGRK